MGVVASKRKYEPILVIWDDAEVSNDWEIQSEGDQLTEALVETLGFLVKETDKHLLIASTLSGEHTNARTKIPKGMVKAIHKVTIGKAK